MAEPATAAAVVIPAAEQPPAPARELSFGERLEAKAKELGANLDDDATPDAPPEAAPAPDKKAKAPAADPKELKRSQLKTLAEELGLNVDDTAVSVAERAEHRAAMRRDKDKLQRERDDWEKTKALTPEKEAMAQRGIAVMEAIERGDPDGFAKATEKFKSFNDFQENFLKRLIDPNYKELQRIQNELDAEKAEKKRLSEESTKRAQGEQYQRARSSYMTNLSEICSKSTNPVVSAFHDDPLFLEAVYRIQEENWNPETESTLTVEQAIKRATKGAKADLESELRTIATRGIKAFPDLIGSTAPAAAAKTNGNGKKPAPKTAVVPATSNGGGGAPKPVGEMSDREWAKYKAQRYAEAED